MFYLGNIFLGGAAKLPYKKSAVGVGKKSPVSNCPLCGGGRFNVVGKFSIDGLIGSWVDRFGFNPIPDAYRGEFLEKRRCCECGLYYYNFHISDFEKLYEMLAKTYRYYPEFRWEYGAAADFIERANPKSLLEIGSGGGGFLSCVKGIVPKISASEYNKAAAKRLKEKGFRVFANDIRGIGEKFDCVCNFEVLEHVFDTDAFLKDSLNLLTRGGNLIIGAPDPEGIGSVTFNGPLNLPPHHQFDFSYKTFEWIAKKYKLKIAHYIKSDLDYWQYEKYARTVAGAPLQHPDIAGFFAAREKYSGHSHLVVFRKK